MDPFRLDEKHALITGGSRGIGLGIARAFVGAGAAVTLVGRGREALEAAEAELRNAGGRAHTQAFDVAETEKLADLVRTVAEAHGPIDILVNNAGITRRGEAEQLPIADFEEVMRVNVTAMFALSQAFARHCIERGARGRIVNIASLMSECSRRMTSAYTASKGAVKMLTKNLAVEWAQFGIGVNAIGPGFIQTDLTKPLYTNPEFDGWVKQRAPAGRWGQPADIGNVAVFLASDAADYVTGQVIYTDGGLLAAL